MHSQISHAVRTVWRFLFLFFCIFFFFSFCHRHRSKIELESTARRKSRESPGATLVVSCVNEGNISATFLPLILVFRRRRCPPRQPLLRTGPFFSRLQRQNAATTMVLTEYSGAEKWCLSPAPFPFRLPL
jgi:hypothetical protein